MLIDRLDVVAHDETAGWPFSVPAVRDVAAHGLTLTSSLVGFIGANGSGKSTLLEAIAEAYGIDVRGGHGARRYGSYLDKSPLGAALRLSRTAVGRRFTGRNATGFFLRAETAFGMLAYMTANSLHLPRFRLSSGRPNSSVRLLPPSIWGKWLVSI